MENNGLIFEIKTQCFCVLEEMCVLESRNPTSYTNGGKFLEFGIFYLLELSRRVLFYDFMALFKLLF